MGPIEDQIKAQHAAETALVQWRTVYESRIERVNEALDAGVSLTKIARILGMSRSHLSKLVSDFNKNDPRKFS